MAYLEELDTNLHFSDLLPQDPELIGPGLLCNVSGTVIGTFGGSGDPVTDLYGWKIYSPSGILLFDKVPGAFPNINYTFIENGTHRVELEVSRGGLPLNRFSKLVEVVQEPIKLLAPDYISCSLLPLEIQAIDPSSSNFSSYIFEWTDDDDPSTVLSTSNTFITTVAGNITVRYFLEIAGETTCDFTQNTKITNISTIDIVSTAAEVCVDGQISFETNPNLFGEWFVQKIGNPSSKNSFGTGISLTISPGSDLDGFGDYEVSFLIANPLNPTCLPSGNTTFSFKPAPIFVFENAVTSTGCLLADGKLEIRAITDLDFITIEESGAIVGSGVSSGPYSAGDLIEIPNLKSGTYYLIGGLGSCTFTLGSAVPLTNPPAELEFQISDITAEACILNGKVPGSFQVTMLNGANPSAFYRVINERGGVALNKPLPNSIDFRVEIPGGKYFFEIYDALDKCILPGGTEVIIPTKDQTNFQLQPNINICKSFSLTPVTFQSLVFSITRPDFTTDSKDAGEPILLDQEGTYTIIGTLPGQTDICPTEKTITVKLIDPVEFDVIQVSEDCTVGNRSYEANIYLRDPASVLFIWRNEQDVIIGTAQRLDLPPSSFGTFSLEVQPANSESCPIPPKRFHSKQPVLSVDVTLVATKLCEVSPKAFITLSTTFPAEVTDVEWRRYDANGNIDVLRQFNNQYQIEVDIEGTYEAAVFSRIPALNKACELGRRNLPLSINPNKVNFSIPVELFICESYKLTPSTSDPIIFEIVRPDYTKITINAGEVLTIDQTGPYSFFGYNPDLNYPLCPEIKTMKVTVFQKIDFTPELFQENCAGQKIYKADIGNTDPNDALFTWSDATGNIISNDQFLTLNSYGNFSLNVQPKGSLPCDQMPADFFVETPILSVNVTLDSDPLCPDATAAAIRADADFTLVKTIEWWFTDPSGLQTELISERNKKEILGIKEGTYEVRISNEVPCQLGFDKLLLMRSTDSVRPVVDEKYQVCPKYEIGPQINPGAFASYEWYFEGNIVSTSPIYKPLLIGDFSLIVLSTEGCAYEAQFATEEECELRAIYPNAIEPSNAAKPFLIYTNYLIDEMDVFIFNKWGQLVFQCSEKNLISEESTCRWDGKYDGKSIPNGSYAIRINYKNLEKGISKTELGTIMVIE